MENKFELKKCLKLVREINLQLSSIYKKKINNKYFTKKDFQIDPVTKLDLKSESEASLGS